MVLQRFRKNQIQEGHLLPTFQMKVLDYRLHTGIWLRLYLAFFALRLYDPLPFFGLWVAGRLNLGEFFATGFRVFIVFSSIGWRFVRELNPRLCRDRATSYPLD